MKFTEVSNSLTAARNISDTGNILYSHWLDNNGEAYIQIKGVVGEGSAGGGTFSSDLYRLSEIEPYKRPNGFDLTSQQFRQSSDNNMIAYVRAIKIDVERRIEEKKEASTNR